MSKKPLDPVRDDSVDMAEHITDGVGTLAVVVNYNSGKWLKACIDSLLSSTPKPAVCVVDNASVDDSLKGLGTALGDVEIIQNTRNVGFARANNQVLRSRAAEFYVLVNPDCVVEPDTIGTMMAAMQKESGIGLASCVINNTDGSIQKTCRRRFPTPRSAMIRTFGLNALFPGKFEDFDYGGAGVTGEVEFVDAISGAFMVVRGSALEKVGYLDDIYFMHCEDLDWCKRFWQAGYKVAFVATARVTHIKGVSGRSLRVNWHLHQGMLRFYKKFYMNEYPKILFGFVYVGVVLSFLAKSTMILVRGRQTDTNHG